MTVAPVSLRLKTFQEAHEKYFFTDRNMPHQDGLSDFLICPCRHSQFGQMGDAPVKLSLRPHSVPRRYTATLQKITTKLLVTVWGSWTGT